LGFSASANSMTIEIPVGHVRISSKSS
jgi:hypothetical protein